MEDLSSISFSSNNNFPYTDLKKVCDLINVEGPILSHFKSKNEIDILYLWVDNDENLNRWLIFETTPDSLANYLYKDITLRDLILNNKQEYLLLCDLNDNLEFKRNSLVKKGSMPDTYLPTEKSYFEFLIPNIYTENSLEESYLHALVDDSISIKIENKTKKYLSAIKVDNLLNVLKNVKQSFENFTSVNFKKDFSASDFANLNFDSLLSAIVKDSELLMPSLEQGSFCASLTTDYLMSKHYSPEIQQWRKETFKKFKYEVIEVEYDSQVLDVLMGKYDDVDRRAIYSPIVDISKDSNDYKISITDKGFKKIKKTFSPISKPIREKLVPKIQLAEEQLPESLIQIIGMAERNDNQLKLNKKAILETKELDYAELTQTTDAIVFQNNELYLKETIDFKIIYDRGRFVIDYPPLYIHIESNAFDAAKNEFYKMIINLYKELISSADNDLSILQIGIRNQLLDMVSVPNINY